MREIVGDREMNSVVVLCVNYHNERDTQTYVEDLLRQEFSGLLSVFIIDNNEGSTPSPLLSGLAHADPRVTIFHPGRNMGYFGAAAWALQRYLMKAKLPDWVIVSNSDILFPTRDFFSRLFSFYQSGCCAVVAPAIRSSLSGKDQNPHMRRRPSRRRMRRYTWVFRYYPLFIAYQLLALCRAQLGRSRVRIASTLSDRGGEPGIEPRMIYAPHGAFILFHKSYFEAGGTLQHGTFLFDEEIFVAETVKALGLRVVYDPRLEVIHREHSTTGIFRSRMLARRQWEAAVYCVDTFFDPNGE
jgi:GT2 family glycosyltransferase